MISKLIPDLLSCPTHLFGILALKKVIQKDKIKKKRSSHMYDDFHAHLVGTTIKAQETNMHGELKGFHPYIYTEETYKPSKLSDFTSLKSVKDMDSTTNWRRLCCFAFILRKVYKHADDWESFENRSDQFQGHFACSHSSMILDRILEADLRLSYSSQMSMIVIFVPSMNESLFGKRLASICSVCVDDVPNVVTGIFLPIFHIS